MFDPANDYGEEFAVYQVGLGADGGIGNASLVPDKWHDVRLEWDLSRSKCLLWVDEKPAGEVPLRNKTLNGISYIRFRSAAREIDAAGFLVDSVRASIEDPYAPPCRAIDQLEQERRYIEKVVPLWR